MHHCSTVIRWRLRGLTLRLMTSTHLEYTQWYLSQSDVPSPLTYNFGVAQPMEIIVGKIKTFISNEQIESRFHFYTVSDVL